MDLVRFEDKHYPILKEWWAQYGWIAPELDCLPRIGYVALVEGKPICAGFFYQSCSGMALMDWVISDKNAPALTRGKSVHKLIDTIIKEAKGAGFKVLYTVTANEHLLAAYERHGLKRMETGATTMAMSLTDKSLEFLKEA